MEQLLMNCMNRKLNALGEWMKNPNKLQMLTQIQCTVTKSLYIWLYVSHEICWFRKSRNCYNAMNYCIFIVYYMQFAYICIHKGTLFYLYFYLFAFDQSSQNVAQSISSPSLIKSIYWSFNLPKYSPSISKWHEAIKQEVK